MIGACAAAIAVRLAWVPGAPPPTREALVAEAQDNVNREQYAEARRLLAQAYAQDPDPPLLFARAQVERLAGDCDAARTLFEAFSETASTEDAAEATRLSEGCIPSQVPIAAAPPGDPTVGPAQPDSPEAKPTVSRWYRDPLGDVLGGTGLAVMGIGVGFLAAAAASPAEPQDFSGEADYDREVRRTRTFERVGVVMVAVGGAAIVGAVVRWTLVTRRGRGSRLSLSEGPLVLRF